MKWQTFPQMLTVLGLAAFGLVLTAGCEVEAPVENDPVVEEPLENEPLEEGEVENDSVDIDVDPDMEPTEPLE